MFLVNSSQDEIVETLEKNLQAPNIETKLEIQARKSVLNYLMRAANLFDEAGLEKEAEMTTMILAKYADHDPATSGLTSEKMLENLAQKGWVFNTDDGQIQNELQTQDQLETKDELEVVDVPEDQLDLDFQIDI